MSEKIPVSPSVLKWARVTSGLCIEDVVLQIDRKRVTAETVLSWENGDQSPTYTQLERLAYAVYKRPLALFFFPEPPQENTPRQAFRTLPDEAIDQLPQRIRILVRKASVMQANLQELYGDINPAKHQITRDVQFNLNDNPADLAKTVRQYLRIDLQQQSKWRDRDEAFKAWRNAIESNGIFVFKDAFRYETFSGFCLYDDDYPVIYINNSKPRNRQIFTLFHELAHLLFRTGGIDAPTEDCQDIMEVDSQRLEVSCNRFVGEFLVPGLHFNQSIKGLSINDTSLQDLADSYHVSREVILRKLLDLKVVNQVFYNQKVHQWAASAKKRIGSGGDYYNTMGAYLGDKYMGTVFRQYYQNRISTEQVAEFLGVKVKHIPRMENRLLGMEITA